MFYLLLFISALGFGDATTCLSGTSLKDPNYVPNNSSTCESPNGYCFRMVSYTASTGFPKAEFGCDNSNFCQAIGNGQCSYSCGYAFCCCQGSYCIPPIINATQAFEFFDREIPEEKADIEEQEEIEAAKSNYSCYDLYNPNPLYIPKPGDTTVTNCTDKFCTRTIANNAEMFGNALNFAVYGCDTSSICHILKDGGCTSYCGVQYCCCAGYNCIAGGDISNNATTASQATTPTTTPVTTLCSVASILLSFIFICVVNWV